MDWSTAYFQHDGDPKHRSKSTVQWLKAKGVNYIDDWPAQSPDLNPIEHLWHHLKLKLSLYDKKAKGVHELWERVEKEWNSFDKEVCIRVFSPTVWLVVQVHVCVILVVLKMQALEDLAAGIPIQ
ncbi:hypothetical protein G6F47_013532 [Rhizopus delemar]|nr:hypothetical protein G6F47_013532 [Rhizopus delemar]